MKRNCILFAALMLLLCTACDKKEPVEELEPEPSVKAEEPIEIESIPEEEPVIEEPIPEEEIAPEPELTEQEKARFELIDKHGIEVVEAWEALSVDPFFDYIGYELVVIEDYDPLGHEVYYHCYKVMEDGSLQDAYVGGNYYVYGVFVSTEAIYDLVDYHNEFFS